MPNTPNLQSLQHRALFLALSLLFLTMFLAACDAETPTPFVLPPTPASTLEPTDAPDLTPGPQQTPTSAPANVYQTLVVLPSPPAGPVLIPSPTPTRGPNVTRMQIPSIGVDAKVIEIGWHVVKTNGVEQVVWDDASYAVGHMMNTFRPGEGGNIVFSGHNNIEGRVFANLWKVKVGDEVRLTTTDGRAFKYRVVEAQIVKEKLASAAQRAANAHYMDATPPERVTIISCYPPTNNTDRVLIVAKPEN